MSWKRTANNSCVKEGALTRVGELSLVWWRLKNFIVSQVAGNNFFASQWTLSEVWQDIFQKGQSGLKFLEIYLGMSQIFKGGFPRDEVGVNVGDFF